MYELTLDEALEEMSSAEDFLEYFEIDYDQNVVHINRLHILQRFHDYLAQVDDTMPVSEEERHAVYKTLLGNAYNDFVESDALTEKVFKVFKTQGPQSTFVPLDEAFK